MQYQSSVFKKTFVFLGALLLLFACEREIEEMWQPTYEYFPLITGKYKIYEIDSVVYDEYNCTVDTVTFQLKEVTGDTIRDGEQAIAYKVERYHRTDSSQPWNMTGVWLEKIEDFQVQRVEDNQRSIKLVFPVKVNKQWDGIVYIRRDTLVPLRGGSIDMFKDWDEFTLTEVDAPYYNPITGAFYAETALVVQADKVNNIERRYSLERYAKNIGLIYKEMKILDTQCRVDGNGNHTCTGVGDISKCLFTPWELKAEKGFILKQTLLEHNY